MTDKEFVAILKDILSQIRFLNAQIKDINDTLDRILKLFKSFEERSPILQETLSK